MKLMMKSKSLKGREDCDPIVEGVWKKEEPREESVEVEEGKMKEKKVPLLYDVFLCIVENKLSDPIRATWPTV